VTQKSNVAEVKVSTHTLQKKTKGAGDLIDLTAELVVLMGESGFTEGNMTVFVIGSTAGIVTFEFESGLIQDMREVYEKIAPSNRSYAHDRTWNDDNGFSHVRAAIQGPSLVIPFVKGKLILGTWQQVVLAEYDIRNRSRQIVVQFLGK